MTRRLILFLAVALAHAADPLADGVQRKLDTIQNGHARAGSVFIVSSAELNAWVRFKLPTIAPEGVRQPHIELGYNSAVATAYVNFLKLRHGAGYETNWFMSKLLDGEKFVKVNVRMKSGGGSGTVTLQRVEIAGIAVSGSTLDFLIDSFFRPLYPNASIDEPFDFKYNIDRIEARPADVRIILKR